jgi:hypothetical protein
VVDRGLLEGEEALLPDEVGFGDLLHVIILANRTHVRKPPLGELLPQGTTVVPGGNTSGITRTVRAW